MQKDSGMLSHSAFSRSTPQRASTKMRITYDLRQVKEELDDKLGGLAKARLPNLRQASRPISRRSTNSRPRTSRLKEAR